MKKITCLILSIVLFTSSANAQRSAILVMLKAERNKINHYNSIGATKKANEVKEEAHKVMEVMMNDFTDHFTLCPVYYFMDTNLALIKQRKFDGILFDNKFRVFESSPVKANDISLSVVYYGIPPVILTDNGHLSDEKNTYRELRYPGDGIVILNGEDFTPKKPRDIVYSYVRVGRVAMSKHPRYNYYSVKNSITYKQMAAQTQKRYYIGTTKVYGAE